MDKVYNHKDHEDEIYKLWEKSGSFKASNDGEPYTILMPPPNANASLHAGHAMYTVDDILIRRKRMQGYSALWIPGMDHAGFETQYVYEKELAKEGLTKVKTEYRVKGLYSLYKKYLRYDKDIEKIYDVSAMRILVDSVAECYQVLGVIHGRWRPLPRRIKDYIAFPKPNGYKAIHTTIFIGDGNIVEVQIKTHEMYRYSEYGIASHLSYKEDKHQRNVLAWVYALLPKSKKSNGTSVTKDKDIPKWISELAGYEEPSKNHRLFRERLVSDFFNHRIFVFSPKGDVVDLPIDSTPIDFAYSIHSDIGDHMTGAKVNGKLVSLDTKLHNGDIVFIMTNETAKPNRKWLGMTKTSMARRHIRHKLSDFKKSDRT